MSGEKKVKQHLESDFSVEVKPIEYEAKGLFLKNLLNEDFVKKLSEGLGDFAVSNIAIFVEKQGEMIMLWHKGSEAAKNGIVTIACKQQEVKEGLFKALGVAI